VRRREACLVETWHDTDTVCFRRLRLDGFQIVHGYHLTTLTTNHGGVAIVSGHLVSFFDDLSLALDRVIGYNDSIYVVGDLNVRLDCDDDASAQRLSQLFDAFGLAVRVHEPTHVRGGLLDVVATRLDLAPPLVNVYDADLSDHRLLEWSVPVCRHTPPIASVVRRPWHQLSTDNLRDALLQSRLCQPDSWTGCSADALAEMYDSEATSILDRLIPARTVTIRRRSSDPWFDHECRETKRAVRRLERSSRSSGTPEATAAWHAKRCEYRALRRRTREQFWLSKIDAEKAKPRQLWRSVDAVLGRGRIPLCDNIEAEQFHRCFDDKVAAVRSLTSDALHRRSRPHPPTSASFSQ